MQILLINLKRRSDRLAVMQERLAGIDFVRIDAVDGREWNAETQAEKTLYPISVAERACLESHKAACQLIIDQELPCACVMEDDVVLSPDFKNFIKDDSWIPSGTKLIKIETLNVRVWLSKQSRPARERKLHQLHSYHAGGAGYILTLEGAKALIGLLEKANQACDDIIFSSTLEDPAFHKVLQLDPALCVQEFVLSEDCSESDILTERTEIRAKLHHKPAGALKLWRELKRPFARNLEKICRWSQSFRVVPFK